MPDDTMKVTLTLRKSVAEKLRRICHNRGATASIVIESWVFEHDEQGRPITRDARDSAVDKFVDMIRDLKKKAQ